MIDPLEALVVTSSRIPLLDGSQGGLAAHYPSFPSPHRVPVPDKTAEAPARPKLQPALPFSHPIAVQSAGRATFLASSLVTHLPPRPPRPPALHVLFKRPIVWLEHPALLLKEVVECL